ncbi:MAG: hypothetical protein ACLUOI_15995 [Eisenbergiella sp.]
METVRIMKKAKEMGCATSLDMAAVDSESDAGKADWKEILRNTLPYVDFFVPSAEELCYMLDQERFALWQERAKGERYRKFSMWRKISVPGGAMYVIWR